MRNNPIGIRLNVRLKAAPEISGACQKQTGTWKYLDLE